MHTNSNAEAPAYAYLSPPVNSAQQCDPFGRRFYYTKRQIYVVKTVNLATLVCTAVVSQAGEKAKFPTERPGSEEEEGKKCNANRSSHIQNSITELGF